MSKQQLIDEFLGNANRYGFSPTSKSKTTSGTLRRSIKSKRTGDIQYAIQFKQNTVRLDLWFGDSNPKNLEGYLRLKNAARPNGLEFGFLDDSIEASREVLQITFFKRHFQFGVNEEYGEIVRQLFQKCEIMRDFVESHLGNKF